MNKNKIERKHWIGAGITLANAANSLLDRVDTLEHAEKSKVLQPSKEPRLGAPDGFGIKPMLLALSMEIALKAWIVFDRKNSEVIRGHNLSELFGQLNSQSKEKLEQRFLSEIVAQFPNRFHQEYRIGNLLEQHKNAFQDWRYFYEQDHLHMNVGEFKATVEMVIREFNKRHYIDDGVRNS